MLSDVDAEGRTRGLPLKRRRGSISLQRRDDEDSGGIITELQSLRDKGGPSKDRYTFQNGDTYDGEWLNGMMHGRGVYSHIKSGNKYDGKWHQNKRSGQGTFTSHQTGRVYEGEWREGLRHGQGSQKDPEGHYNGEWRDDRIQGQGKYEYADGDMYTGGFSDEYFNGHGTLLYANADVYEGGWRDGHRHGQGKMVCTELGHEYDGEWVEGKKQGRGMYTCPEFVYNGEWYNDKMRGRGQMRMDSGDVYDGEWLHDREHGEGTWSTRDGDRYTGHFSEGHRDGQGVYSYNDNQRYDGEWLRGLKSGRGSFYYSNGSVYEGPWAEDVPHGVGTCCFPSGRKYQVRYNKGVCIEKTRMGSPGPTEVKKPEKKTTGTGGGGRPAKLATPRGFQEHMSLPSPGIRDITDSFETASPSTYSPGAREDEGGHLLPGGNTGSTGSSRPTSAELTRFTATPSLLEFDWDNTDAVAALGKAAEAIRSGKSSPLPAVGSPRQQSTSRSPRGYDDDSGKSLALAVRESLDQLMTAVANPDEADPSISTECRNYIPNIMAHLRADLSGGVRKQLSDLNTQLVDVLQMWDTAQYEAPRRELERLRRVITEKDAQHKAETQAVLDEERRKYETQLRISELKMQQMGQSQQEEDLQMLREQLEEAKKKRTEVEFAEARHSEQEQLNVQYLTEIRTLKADLARRPSMDQVAWLKAQIENENAQRKEAESREQERKEQREARQLKEEEDRKNQVAPEVLEEQRRQFEEEIEQLKKSLAEKEAAGEDTSHPDAATSEEVRRLRELYQKEVALRKKLHNDLVELKGNIRVYCRVRPMDERERIQRGGTDCIKYPTEDTMVISGENEKKGHHFEFDKVFPPGTSQEAVFEDTLPIITSVLDGYNVCIFAYGQTGSGKSFTMSGPPSLPGVIPRSLTELFRLIQDRSETDDCTVQVSVLEIYNEVVRDLQRDSHHQEKYTIRTDPFYGQVVDNLELTKVKSAREIDKILDNASRNRTEGKTNMNEHSSRSHMLLYIIVSIRNLETGVQSCGKLSLIDLAGSERIGKSGVVGEALREAQHINKSLSALGDVMSAYVTRSKHIPYRNSVLTHLLQDSLGGRAKVLMFANCSPLSGDAQESMGTLGFAARARGVELGRAKKNIEVKK